MVPLRLLILVILTVLGLVKAGFAQETNPRGQISIELFITCVPRCESEIMGRRPNASRDDVAAFCGASCGCMAIRAISQITAADMAIMVQRQPPPSALQDRVRRIRASCQERVSAGLAPP